MLGCHLVVVPLVPVWACWAAILLRRPSRAGMQGSGLSRHRWLTHRALGIIHKSSVIRDSGFWAVTVWVWRGFGEGADDGCRVVSGGK